MNQQPASGPRLALSSTPSENLAAEHQQLEADWLPCPSLYLFLFLPLSHQRRSFVTAQLRESLLDDWRRSMAQRQSTGRRPLAAFGSMVDGPVRNGLVELDHMTLVVLYNEPSSHDQLVLRLAGYSGTQVPWGVMWGGAEQNRFFKDLSLQPVPQGRGLRLDLARPRLLRIGLQLERELDRYARHPALPPRPNLRLPCLWAAFTPQHAVGLAGDGPELDAYARRVRKPVVEAFSAVHRRHYGLVLHPLAWVSRHGERTAAIFVDLARFPGRQVFRLDDLPGNLAGYQDAAEFNLFESRFRRRIPHGHRLAVV